MAQSHKSLTLTSLFEGFVGELAEFSGGVWIAATFLFLRQILHGCPHRHLAAATHGLSDQVVG